MNQHKAIAAVTDTLRQVLDNGRQNLPGLDVQVTIGLPEVDPNKPKRINLFLYSTAVNASWRNMDLPGKVKPGETGQPPLAIDLFYILTAYGTDDSHAESHELLGQAMSILHDSPLLNADEIKYNDGTEVYVHQQIERIRITPKSLSLDELNNLWSTFQTAFRISAAYQVGVVLIESTRPTKTPLPVRRRGREDDRRPVPSETPESIGTAADPSPPLPEGLTILGIEPVGGHRSIELGTPFLIRGYNLRLAENEKIEVRLRRPGEQNPIPLVDIETQVTAEGVRVILPDPENNPPNGPPSLAGMLHPGSYELSLAFVPTEEEEGEGEKGKERQTREKAVALSAKIQSVAGTATTVNQQKQIRVDVTVECVPRVDPQQEVALLFRGKSVALTRVEPESEKVGSTLVFSFVLEEEPQFPLTTYVRVQVDGVDSLLIEDMTVEPPSVPQYREAAKLTIEGVL